MKEYTFDFNNGFYANGKPINVKNKKFKGNTIAEAEKKLKVRYPHARLVSLNGRIKEL